MWFGSNCTLFKFYVIREKSKENPLLVRYVYSISKRFVHELFCFNVY